MKSPRWLKRWGIQKYTGGLWLCFDGGLTENTTDEDLCRFVTQGGGVRWMMAKGGDVFLTNYRVRLIPGSRPSPPEAPK